MTAPDLSIILPTYNEAENITNTIRTIRAACNGLSPEIVVVDDHSPDGTAAIATPLAEKVITRTERGLSGAILRGFQEASGEVLVVTDADLSHDISRIPQMYQMVRDGYDLVVGSRYMTEGGIENWPLSRRIISLGATWMARQSFPFVTDPVSGFFAVRRSVVNGLDHSAGFKILVDILDRGHYRSVAEVPYVFTNRKRGASKLSLQVVREFMDQIARIERNGRQKI